MNLEGLIGLVVAVIGSGGISSVITTILQAKKHTVETEQLRQQVEESRVETKIKLDEHFQEQMVQLTKTYQNEFENYRTEIENLRTQNQELAKQVTDLSAKINQLMSWVVYDSMRYQDWLEQELLKREPEIIFPTFRKPPKFVQSYMDDNDDAPDVPPIGYSEHSTDEEDNDE